MTNDVNEVEVLRSFTYLGAGVGPASAPLSSTAARWPFRHAPPRIRAFVPSNAIGSDWRDPNVGWGLILPDDPDLNARSSANADDAPEPIRELLRRRPGAVVLRYRAGSVARARLLWDATSQVDVSIASSPVGVSAGCLPKYLLIYANPVRIPWSLQCALNVTRCVGRLDLEGEALENYVAALLSGWVHVPQPANTAVVWATNHHAEDATARGRDLVAEPIVRRFTEDERSKKDVIFLDGPQRATAPRLLQALRSERPCAVVISSSGNFPGCEDAGCDPDSIGSPVDQNGVLVKWQDVLSLWDPCGAVWYANSSYSAGACGDALFDGLVEPDSGLGRSLLSDTRVGPMSAPLARALLGARRPVRAFVGHVGPLFATSLRVDARVRSLMSTLVGAAVATMIEKRPIASVLASEWFKNVPLLYAEFDRHLADFNANKVPASVLVRDLLTVLNVERTVFLGDPTVIAQESSGEVLA